MSLDTVAQRELELYIENDSQLYHSQFIPIVKNLAAKIAKTAYDREKAVKLWMYLMDAGAKKYCTQYGTGIGSNPHGWNEMFSVETRRAAARNFNKSFLDEFSLGNYHQYLPKKWQHLGAAYFMGQIRGL